MTEKKIKELIFRVTALIYMTALTVFISNYILKVFETELWDNERVAMRTFIAVGMFVSLGYLTLKEKSILKLMFVYHFVLVGTAICVMLPQKFMPLMIIPMVVTAIYDIKTGLIVAASVGSAVMMGMGNYPLYVFSSALIIILATSCFAVGKFDKTWKNIVGQASFLAVELILLLYFKKYCEELGMIYEKNSFIISVMITSVVCMVLANGVKIFADRIIYKKTPTIIIRKLTSADSEVVQLIKKKSASLYYHSNEVAEMSRLAAKRIGADYNLAYAGGLFHDLGKVSGSEYIKEGLKLAEQYGIPKDIRTIMVEHNVKSRLPKSKEAAIVMLSDTVVSTIEYVKGTMDKKEISEQVLVENAINKRLTSGALNKSGLTIEEFNIIKETLINIKEQQ
ncbi:MAG: HDIG domain-containing protein [Lachnospiraceae bacterium]|nr:HDIG domain-containing protein [Lachnospiraceae bacterium]